MTASPLPDDVIDAIASVDDRLDAVRRRRPDVRKHAQGSAEALFLPVDDAAFPVAERWLVAAFATRLTADDATAAFYAERAGEAAPDEAGIVIAEAARTAAAGPYGRYAEPGLRDEDAEGPRLRAEDLDPGIAPRLAAALEHDHLLTHRLRETDGAAHDRLLDAGWSVDGIVTLSQLIAFLAFQQRVAAGLRVLAGSSAAASEAAA